MSGSFLKRAFSSLVDLVYPPRCPLCDAFVPERGRSCDACAAVLARLEGDAHAELPGRLWFARARSCFAYEGRVRDALHAMKYANRLDLVRFFATELAEEARRLQPCDLVVAVPMASGRLRGRGSNAAALLARTVARRIGARCEPLALRRTRQAPPQVGLPREERVRNVAGLFATRASIAGRITGAHVLLIDDVLTTGATANDAARALMRAGAAEVRVLTVARALG